MAVAPSALSVAPVAELEMRMISTSASPRALLESLVLHHSPASASASVSSASAPARALAAGGFGTTPFTFFGTGGGSFGAAGLGLASASVGAGGFGFGSFCGVTLGAVELDDGLLEGSALADAGSSNFPSPHLLQKLSCPDMQTSRHLAQHQSPTAGVLVALHLWHVSLSTKFNALHLSQSQSPGLRRRSEIALGLSSNCTSFALNLPVFGSSTIV
eukprot:CAMPEP_0169244814 /NCGR_PEP_ID=MMETSP1016-20121227/33851_1 /TAXON_ID=342587 /ORGANISM="Karlodinium micrum, Strain CCMP2283" /LENGTH=215 /DNA_ID=CAMNT_0009325251 /DNA_START=492 /DNA_END=1138 /DNA_ORIENTATION=-